MRSTTIQIERQEDAATSIAPDFNPLARIYRWMEWLTFGPMLQRTRSAFLTDLLQQRRALVLGDGDGRFTARLTGMNTSITVDAVDASAAMLQQLERRAVSTQIHTYCVDARIFQPAGRDYDLIATHFFLDCLTHAEVKALACRLRHHVRPDALWVVSEFAIPSNFYGSLIARPLISFLYLAFGLLAKLKIRRLPDHRLALSQTGWSLQRSQPHLGGLLISELWRPER